MHATRVMVVDDSAAMRALFCGILENAKGVDVCGVACNADEARAKLDDCRPDVLTLDVEMPGMSGMDFLAEIMEQRPMPVIMLSSIAQAGSGVAKRAMELGAVHCFPKPLHSSQEEFDATVRKLGDIVIRAHHGELGAEDAAGSDDAASAPPASTPANAPATSAFANYRSDGSLVVIACGDAGLADAMALIAAYPADCPPTILVIDADRGPVEAAIAAASGSAACSVVAASDGLALAPGTVAVAYDRAHHVIVEAGSPPRLRCAVRDPVGGIRPCADLLLGSIARARVPAKGGLLAGTRRDQGRAVTRRVQGSLPLSSIAGTSPAVTISAYFAPRSRRFDPCRSSSRSAQASRTVIGMNPFWSASSVLARTQPEVENPPM